MTNSIKSVCKASLVAAPGGLLLGLGAVVITAALPSMESFFVLNGAWDVVWISLLTFGCIIGVTLSKKAGEFFEWEKRLENSNSN